MSTPWSQWMTSLHRKVAPNATRQAIASASAINLDSVYVTLTTTGATYAITLAPPTLPAVDLVIEMIARGGAFNVTLSLANVTGGTASTTCTWNGTGQILILKSAGSKWVVIKQSGVTLT